MAWKGRSDLEKQMRKANDRLRTLEQAGETRSAAYREALRQMRLAEGDPNAARPRFSPERFGGDVTAMKKALKQFEKSATSTKRGIQAAAKKTQRTYESRHGVKLTSEQAKKVGEIWQAISKGRGKYRAAEDTARQDIIIKHLDEDPDDIARIFDMMEEEEIPMDEWEEFFDEEIAALHDEDDWEDVDEDDDLPDWDDDEE